MAKLFTKNSLAWFLKFSSFFFIIYLFSLSSCTNNRPNSSGYCIENYDQSGCNKCILTYRKHLEISCENSNCIENLNLSGKCLRYTDSLNSYISKNTSGGEEHCVGRYAEDGCNQCFLSLFAFNSSLGWSCQEKSCTEDSSKAYSCFKTSPDLDAYFAKRSL